MPQRQGEAPLLYARPAVTQGTVHPEPDSGTAAADVAAVNTTEAPPPATPAKADAPLHAVANAAYAMVGTMPAATLHPLRDG